MKQHHDLHLENQPNTVQLYYIISEICGPALLSNMPSQMNNFYFVNVN